MKIRLFLVGLMLMCALASGAVVANAQPAAENDGFTVNAKSAVLMDYDTGTVVYSQNEKLHLPIASMVKIMTLGLVFDEIEAGNLAETDMIRASQNAASMGGSQAFLDANSDYAVGELIKSIVVGSANDSCVALAEHIAGSTEAFVARMNQRARDLGLEDTRFVNCTGLPAGDQYCCAADVAVMTRALLRHSRFFDYSKVWMFDFVHPSGRKTQLSNTNKLIRAYEGCDGGKTGFTNEAKYCLSATAKRGNTRLISVVCGAESSKVRNAQNAALFNYGFANYETAQVVLKDKPLEQTFTVEGGKEQSVQLYPVQDKFIFAKKGSIGTPEYSVELLPLKAPLARGEVVGVLRVTAGSQTATVELACDRDVKKRGYLDIVDELITSW